MITLPISSLPGIPRLFTDYVNDRSDARNFFMGHFSDLMAYETHLQHIERRTYLRDALYEALVVQNKRFYSAAATFAHLEAFRKPNTVAVVTGQQVGLFTGPLYTIYKALTAVQLARWLAEQFPAYGFIPMFWLESEDHDFAEINHAGVITKENEFARVLYGSPEIEEEGRNLTPISRLVIDERMQATMEQLRGMLQESEFTDDLLRSYRNAYATGGNLQTAFARLFNDLFPESGLVFVDPSDTALKQLAAPVILQELETYPTTGEEVIKRSAELEERYHAQIKPRAVNLFFLHKENRYPIEPNEYGFFLRGTRQRFTRDELLEIANAEPERFSPNVLLRPIMQDFLLPTAAYVAGPSEVSYFAQLQPAYDHFQIPMPIIFPRASITLIERKVDKVFRKFDLPYAGMFLDDEEAFRLITHEETGDTLLDLDTFRTRMEDLLEEFLEGAKQEHANLEGPADTTAANIRRSLAAFEDKLYQQRRQRNEVLTRQIEKMHVYLAPEGKPQERQVNLATFLNRYGREVLEQIEDACVPFPAEHRLVFL
ncbi:MAG: bacillithiol biosynthesis cysteine-adding enzyme BshC [Bacteroidetes bacterium]|nr:bacillithiol biosynthesis cysteine-adding enzyme BshC [Bacteroidota bacterium]